MVTAITRDRISAGMRGTAWKVTFPPWLSILSEHAALIALVAYLWPPRANFMSGHWRAAFVMCRTMSFAPFSVDCGDVFAFQWLDTRVMK